MKKIIYADNASTTCISENVLGSMMPFLTNNFGNPSSVHRLGRDAKKALEEARLKIAKALSCDKNEIFFTSGGTESNNHALTVTAKSELKKGKNHIITTNIEHHSVINTCRYLKENNFDITFVKSDHNGFVDPDDIRNAITDKTALVSVMYANNEIGTIQPVKEIGDICKKNNILFHTDAVQAFGHTSIDLKESAIDMLSLSGHKFHAPKGTGVLYIRNGTDMQPLIYGGAQEKNIRAGTENLASIVGMGTASAEAVNGIDEKNKLTAKKRDYLMKNLLSVSGIRLNGSHENRLCGNLNIMIEGVDSESMILTLDLKGICVSGASACTTGDTEPSHVLLALGLTPQEALSSIRFSIDETITYEELDYICECVNDCVKKLRK